MSILNRFAVVVKRALFCVRIHRQQNFLVVMFPAANPILLVSSGASRVIGLIGALRVIALRGDLRRFVAYTSINQVGFILAGLTCSTTEGTGASLVYRLTYRTASVRFIGVVSRLQIREEGKTPRGVETFADLKRVYDSSELRFSRRLDL